MSILIKNTVLITMNNKKEILQDVDILIDANKIKQIGNISSDVKVEKTIDGSGKVTMPGLINTHTHIPMSLFRNYADDLPFWEWLYEKILPLEENLTGQDIYWGSMLSIAEMIKSGITSFVDMYFYIDNIAEAVEETGIRGFLALSVTDIDGDRSSREKTINEIKNLIEKWDGEANGRINIRIAPHAPYSCSNDFLKLLVELSKQSGKGLNIHVSESKKEIDDSLKLYGKSPVERLNELGVFDISTIAVHCVHLTDRDIEILKEKNISVSNNPGSNLKLGNGYARVDELLKQDINVSLGTDGSASNNNLNMFEEMNLASLINKGLTNDPESVPAYKALEMATINGAKALELENELGSIEVGKIADIIIIDLDKPHFYPRNNIVSSLVYSAQASDVETVIVDGQVIMEQRELLNIDLKDIIRNIELRSRNLVSV